MELEDNEYIEVIDQRGFDDGVYLRVQVDKTYPALDDDQCCDNIDEWINLSFYTLDNVFENYASHMHFDTMVECLMWVCEHCRKKDVRNYSELLT
jgi:hypothetical protein